MAIKATIKVPQGDDHPLHVTVRNKSTGLPMDLTEWSAFIEVAPDALTDTEPLFRYDQAPNLIIDPGPGGGISLLFAGPDILVPSEMDPDVYRLKITHPTEAPNGRTVLYGLFIVLDT